MIKKIFYLMISLIVISMLLSACGTAATATKAPATVAPATAAPATAAPATATTAPVVRTPLPAGSSGKIAVLRNLGSSDHTSQYFAGTTAEGEALGYKVDTFMTDSDDVKMQDLMETMLQKDYKIWIVGTANEGYQFDEVSKAVAKGISVVCFDCGGKHVPGVTYTSQNDTQLAALSLDALIGKATAGGAKEPIKFIEINTLGALVPFDTRHTEVEKYVTDGKLERVNLVSPAFSGDIYAQVYTGISTTLEKDTKHEIKGIWMASSYFADATEAALKDAKRSDIVVTAIDISTTEIQRLANEPTYYAVGSVDPYVIGLVDVRLGVLESMGIKTPETVALDAVAVTKNDVTASDTMFTLAGKFSGFGSSELYNTQEIKDLKAKVAGK